MSRYTGNLASTFEFAGPSIIADIDGFAEFVEAYRAIEQSTEITLDLSSVTYIESHMLATLKVIMSDAAARGTTVKCVGKNAFLSDGFALNHSPDFASNHPADNDQSHIRSFKLNDEIGFSRHIAQLLQRTVMLSITSELERKIVESLQEIFANCAMHSCSHAGAIFGTAYHAGRNLICFAIADSGRGIPGSTRDARLQFASDEIAIKWAMEPNNTTKPANIPGGLGSVVLRNFIESNGGRLIVVSRRGLWEQIGGNVRTFPLPYIYPGTAVIVEVVAGDPTAYDSTLDFDPNDMW